MNKTTILIVEDEAIIAADLAGKLERLGYEVAGITAEGQEAVALASRLRPHLVLMDISLSGSMDGIEAAEAIQREYDVPLIYLTAHSDPATLCRAKVTGPFGYILKPFEDRELATQIELAIYKHQAVRQIREQREWLRVTLTSIGDAVIATDAAGRITFINPVAESLTGWNLQEAMGRPVQSLFRIVNEQTGEAMEEPVARVLRAGLAVVLANHSALVTRDGRTIPIEDSAAPILNAEGQVIGAVLVFHDVTEKRRAAEALQNAHDELEHRVEVRTAELTETNRELKREIEERKNAETAVRESEEKYRVLIKMLPSVVYKGYKDWSIKFFDEKIQSFTGYRVDEFNSRKIKWHEVILEEDVSVVKENFIQALKTDKTYVREYRIKKRSGEILWIQDRGHIICDSRGGVEYISGVFFDITARKRQEEELQKSKKLLQSVFDGITDPLLLMDKNLKVSIANHAAMRYYQIKELGDISEECCYKAFLGKSAPCEGCQVPAAIANMKTSSFERKGVMNPGNLEQVTIYPLDENEHRFSGALIRVHDITESRLMERKIVENEKLALLGFAISCISHEITNPISAITFNAPILQDYINTMISIVDDHARYREDLELFQMPYPQFRDDVFKIMANIIHASNRVRTTVSDLRKLYGKKKPEKEKRCVDLKQLIERTTALARVEIGQYVKSFEINVPENLIQIYTDPDAVEHILANLLINAAHAADKEDSRVMLDVIQGDTWKDHLIIKISDNGCGMDMETLSKIFDPFFSTKPTGQGSGLGLYVCQDLVKDLGGRIEVQSEPGSGSTFSVVLPDIERRSAKRV